MINFGLILPGTDPTPIPKVEAEQVHQTGIALVDQSHAGQTIPAVDGLISQQQNLFLIVRTADCLPIAIYDPDHPAIGLLHAGYTGVNQKIHLHAISLFKDKFKSRPQSLLINLGPSICPRCYHRHFDLAGTVKHDLINRGVTTANIDQSTTCTYEDSRFPSHQRHRTKDRIINFISLKP